MCLGPQGIRSALRHSVSCTETACRVGCLPGGLGLFLEALLRGPLSPSVMSRVSTEPCSATAPQDTAGVWTVGGRREQGPGLCPELPPPTATDQVRPAQTQHITCTHLLNTLFKETALKKKGNVFNGVEKMCFSHKVENSSTFVLPVSGDKPHIISLRKKGDMIKRGTLWCVETRRSEGPFYTKEICEVRSAV